MAVWHRAHTIVLALVALLVAVPASACECLWQGGFTAVADQAQLIVSGEVVASKGNSFDVQIEEILRGQEYGDSVRVWGDTGQLCRPQASRFAVGSHWVLALKRIDQVPEGGFNPNTPNVSFGRPGDYSLNKCGVYWLEKHGDLVSGHLVEAPRWQYADDGNSPVLMSLLKGWLAGSVSLDALQQAEKPRKKETRELMHSTREFLRELERE